MYVYMCVYIYIERERYIYTHVVGRSPEGGPAGEDRDHPVESQLFWVFIKGGCIRRGVQWMGVVLYNKEA